MAITEHPEFADEAADALVNVVLGKACFYCAKPTEHPAVYWNGCSGDVGSPSKIILHPNCATTFALRLIWDGYVADCDAREVRLLVQRYSRIWPGAMP